MGYELQSDLVRPEAKQGQATPVSLYPTLNGARVSALGSTWEVFDRSGKSYGSGTTNPTSVMVGTKSVSEFQLTIPAISDLDEDYRLEVTWTDASSMQRVSIVTFDVVIAPLGDTLSYSDLQEELQSVGPMLVTFGQRLGETGTDEAKRDRAMYVLAKKARAEMIAWLRTAEGPRPYMIIDRYAINPVERTIALRDLFLSIAKNPEDGEISADASYRHYRMLAKERFANLRIAYSEDDDLTPDDTTRSLGASHSQVREQS